MAIDKNNIRKKFESIRNFRKNWKLKNPNEKWYWIYDMASIGAKLVGVRVFTTNQRTFYTYSSVFSICIFFVSIFNAFIHYARNGQIFHGLRGLGVASIVVPISCLDLVSIGPDRFEMKKMIIYGGRYIYKTHGDTMKWNLFYHQGIDKLVKLISIVVSLNVISYSIVGFQFFMMFIAFDERVNFAGMIVPFTDDTSDTGYYFNSIIQIGCFLDCLLGNFTSECVACIYNNTITAMAEFIRLKAEDLNEILNSTELRDANEINLKRIEIKAKIRDILIHIQDFDRYVLGVGFITHGKFYYGTFCCVYTIPLLIFCQYIGIYPVGYTIAFCAFVQLMIVCYSGQNAENSNNKICKALYNIQWYDLDRVVCNDLARMLQRTQNGVTLTVGPFYTLNMRAATMFTNRIYTFVMLLFKFL